MNKGGLERVFKLLNASGYISMTEFQKADAGEFGTRLLPPGNPLAHSVYFRIGHKFLVYILAFNGESGPALAGSGNTEHPADHVAEGVDVLQRDHVEYFLEHYTGSEIKSPERLFILEL